jgi:hypothetical protein
MRLVVVRRGGWQGLLALLLLLLPLLLLLSLWLRPPVQMYLLLMLPWLTLV